jgi:D-cysteine desulfhydrase family pyridoxal phosphate-dependent enzyme
MKSLTDRFPRVPLVWGPTPIEQLRNTSGKLGGLEIWIKRDDLTGLALGGNKLRQLEYYLGEALARGADTVLTTGAVQSNHATLTCAAARHLGLGCIIQREERVPLSTESYRASGNVLLQDLLGARHVPFPVGEDEQAADRSLATLAEVERKKGRNPYVISTGIDHPPLGALGYVDCAREILEQAPTPFDAVVVASGGGNTHAGLLAGFRSLGSSMPVHGVCVRRERRLQKERMAVRCHKLEALFGREGLINEQDLLVIDDSLGEGYGRLNDETLDAIHLVAREDGVLLDPVYTGKAMAGLIHLVKQGIFGRSDRVLFLHTGGLPGLFAYSDILREPQK